MRGVPAGIPGAGAPRLIAIDRDVWAVVSDAPLERFTGEQLQQEMQDVEAISRHAVAHDAVIEFFFRSTPVIPLKLFTLFSSDEKVYAHVRAELTALKRMFAALRGLEEWGVRIIAGEVEAESARSLDSGRDYLQVKKRLNAQTIAPPRATLRAIDTALRSLGRVASKMRTETLPTPGRGRPYAAGASFLVAAKRRPAWKKHAAALASELAGEGHRLEMSGPWPPYHFVSK
jgi:Gas vesicle synthesis protein GvpL/GvpF